MRSELSPRQLEVLLLLARGCNEPEMVEIMGVTVTTVKQHIVNMRAKLGASSRVHAVALGYQEGLLT